VQARVRNIVKSLSILVARLYLVVSVRWRRRNPRRIIRATAAFFGHLALEPENYLASRIALSRDSWATPGLDTTTRDWWTLGKIRTSPNPTMARAWRRHINVPPSWWVDAVIRAGERDPRRAIPQTTASLFGVGNVLDGTTSQFSLSQREQHRAQSELEKLGVDLRQPYVALIVRDEKYFDKVGKGLSDGRMRNRSITDFAPMSVALAQLGIQVIRLGHLVGSELGVEHPMVFDYATSGKRSELLDIYIPLTATAAVSTLTGSDAVSMVGRRPVLYVDISLYAQVFHSTRLTTWVPARIRDRSNGRLLTLTEVFKKGIGWFVTPQEFHDSQVEVIYSTPAEIAAYASSYAITILQEGNYQGNQFIQKKVTSTLTNVMGSQGQAMHGAVRSQLHEDFLAKYSDFIG